MENVKKIKRQIAENVCFASFMQNNRAIFENCSQPEGIYCYNDERVHRKLMLSRLSFQLDALCNIS